MNVAPKAPFWLRGNDQLLRDLDAQSSGLAAAEAGKRRAQYGPNIAVVPMRRSVLAKILRKLADPLPLILLIAAVISGATGDWRSFIIISLIVAFSVTLDIVQ